MQTEHECCGIVVEARSKTVHHSYGCVMFSDSQRSHVGHYIFHLRASGSNVGETNCDQVSTCFTINFLNSHVHCTLTLIWRVTRYSRRRDDIWNNVVRVQRCWRMFCSVGIWHTPKMRSCNGCTGDSFGT